MRSKSVPAIDPWDRMQEHFLIVEKLTAEVVEIWNREAQTVKGAEEVLASIVQLRRDFNNIAKLQSDDNGGEVVAHIEFLYSRLVKIAEGNLRVANGLNPVRDDGYEDDFIGPTGYIWF